MAKVCPFRYDSNDRGGEVRRPCMKEDCALWSATFGCCGLLVAGYQTEVTARAKDNIEAALNALVD